MSQFKKMVSRDVDSVFLDMRIFADNHLVRIGRTDYGEIPCVVDTSVSKQDSEYEGVFQSLMTLYVNERDVMCPVVDEEIFVDDQRYLIANVSRESGMLVLTCEIYRD